MDSLEKTKLIGRRLNLLEQLNLMDSRYQNGAYGGIEDIYHESAKLLQERLNTVDRQIKEMVAYA